MEDRKQFFSRLTELSDRERAMVELAYILAKYSHRAQSRQEIGEDGSPLRYFEHPRRVALIILDKLRILDWELVVIALLHDVVEDTEYATARQLAVWFTPRVAECVGLVSKLPKAGYVKRLEECSEWRALVVKACDTLDNLRSLEACAPEKRRRKVAEYREKYAPVFERMLEIVPVPNRRNAEDLFGFIRSEVERLEAL